MPTVARVKCKPWDVNGPLQRIICVPISRVSDFTGGRYLRCFYGRRSQNLRSQLVVCSHG